MAFAASFLNLFSGTTIMQEYLVVGTYSGAALIVRKDNNQSKRKARLLAGQIKLRIVTTAGTADVDCAVDEEENTFQAPISGYADGTIADITPIYVNGASTEIGTGATGVTLATLVATPGIKIKFPRPGGLRLTPGATGKDDELIDRRYAPSGTYEGSVQNLTVTSHLWVINPTENETAKEMPASGILLQFEDDGTWKLEGSNYHKLTMFGRCPAVGFVKVQKGRKSYYFTRSYRLRIRRR